MHEIAELDDAGFLTIFSDDIDTINGRFMDTAAIITQLDLVVTVDTAIAHLAAALGIETWVLLPEPADWRWMLTRTDSPWYPTMRLFRQTTRGDWEGLMREVTVALAARLEKKDNHAA
jgi:ADP-heptose:LPS heptosyltransferase